MALSIDFKQVNPEQSSLSDTPSDSHKTVGFEGGFDDRTNSNMTSEEQQALLYSSNGRGKGRNESSPTPLLLSTASGSSSSSSRLGPKHFTPLRYWKNLIVISGAFMLTFSAYSALANLQTSLNYSSGIGVASLCAIYVGVIVSSLLSPLVIWILRVKWTMVVCSVFYAIYSACNIYPSFITLIPAAALLGLAASPFWTALGTYITTSSIQLADVTGNIPEVVINRFNGVFFCFFQSAQVWGNLISSLVLSNSSSSIPMEECGRSSCGSNINFNNITQDVDIARGQTLLLLLIYIGLGLLATATILLLLDTLPKAGHMESKTWKTHLSDHLASTFRLMKTPYLFLLIPLMIYNGAEQAYISADFTKAFVSCTRGPGNVGYVMMGFGVADALSSAIFGQIEKYVGRISIFIFGGMLHMGLMILMEEWAPHYTSLWPLILMAAAWGVGDAVWQTQISSILGVLFPESQEPAFANFRLWQAVGFAMTYALTIPPPICVYHKLYGLMAFLAFSLLCYILEEYLISRPVPPWTD